MLTQHGASSCRLQLAPESEKGVGHWDVLVRGLVFQAVGITAFLLWLPCSLQDPQPTSGSWIFPGFRTALSPSFRPFRLTLKPLVTPLLLFTPEVSSWSLSFSSCSSSPRNVPSHLLQPSSSCPVLSPKGTSSLEPSWFFPQVLTPPCGSPVPWTDLSHITCPFPLNTSLQLFSLTAVGPPQGQGFCSSLPLWHLVQGWTNRSRSECVVGVVGCGGSAAGCCRQVRAVLRKGEAE